MLISKLTGDYFSWGIKGLLHECICQRLHKDYKGEIHIFYRTDLLYLSFNHLLIVAWDSRDLSQHWFSYWLFADSTKPLAEPMLMYHQRGPVALSLTSNLSSSIGGISHRDLLGNFILKITIVSPRSQWINLLSQSNDTCHLLTLNMQEPVGCLLLLFWRKLTYILYIYITRCHCIFCGLLAGHVYTYITMWIKFPLSVFHQGLTDVE